MAAALKNKLQGVELLYVGSSRPGDRQLVEAAGLRFEAIASGKLRRYFDLQNVIDMGKVALGWWQAKNILRKFKPDIVFAKGGAVTLPIIVAAGQMGIPVVASESDIRVGLSNRIPMKWITKLAVSFPVGDVVKHTPGISQYRNRMVETGLPVDPKLTHAPAQKPFANGKPIVLITGGSQGASFINQMVTQSVSELIKVANIIHYTGAGDYSTILSYYRQLPDKFKGSWIVRGFDVEDFRGFLQGADIVVSRSGSFIMELELAGKVAILVPLPTSASNHQYLNAQFLAQHQAAVVIKQADLTPDLLVYETTDLLGDNDRRKQMSKKMKELGEVHIKAADKIADLVIETVNR